MVNTNSINIPTTNHTIPTGNGTGFSAISAANNSTLVTSGAGVPSLSTTLPTAVQGNITTLNQSVLTSTANTGATSQWALTNTATTNASSARIVLSTSTNSATQSYAYFWAFNNFSGYSFGCNSTQNNYWLWRGSPLAGVVVASWDVNSLFANAGAISCGTSGVVGGNIQMNGSASQSVTLTPAANAGDWSFNLPDNPGTAGQALLSDGGSGGMTWGGSPVTFTGDTGTPFTIASVVIYADTAGLSCGSSVSFVASTPNLTLQLTDINGNVFLGNGAGSTFASGGAGNGGNVSVGASTLSNLGTGANNTSIGSASGNGLITGSGSVLIGNSAGQSYTGAESYNIVVGVNGGVVGESNVLRIGGGTGTGSYQQNVAYISGITGATLSAGSPTPHLVMMDTSDDQLVCPTPVDASSASSTFGSLAVGTALQNTANYPIMVNVSMAVTAATTAVILVGVGSTNTPTAQAVTASFTVAALTTYSFSFVVPSKFYAKVTTTGTITVGSITTLATQIG